MSESAEFLTEDELASMICAKSARKQMQWLDDHGWRYERNAAGAANAVVAAQMALAGIQSVIPPDEIIDAMYEIGCQLPACLRETSQAGLATTPTGQKIAEKLGQNQF